KRINVSQVAAVKCLRVAPKIRRQKQDLSPAVTILRLPALGFSVSQTNRSDNIKPLSQNLQFRQV
ncbi:hypothetical protein J6590_079824, partial [Homalodisca vitripennis]